MRTRLSGAARLGLPAYAIMLLISWPIMVLAILVYLLDTSWQILTGSDGITADNPVAKVHKWYTGAFWYVLYGDTSTTGGKSVRRWTR
jgi:hypothetical protein